MHEWEVWAPGDPHRAAVLDTHTGRAVCVSFKHTMHVIQTSLSAHKDSMQLCPPPSVRNRDRQGRGRGCGMFHPYVYSYRLSTFLSPDVLWTARV